MKLSFLIPLFLLAPFIFVAKPNLAIAKAGGKFDGRLITEWLDDGRNMRLMDSFIYRSPDNLLWKVPSGTVVDGASIPRFLWSAIGSPFGDKYRKASVIHDHYCEARNRDPARVHRVFYEAMLDSGVGAAKAWLMYQAVERFGPRWEFSADKETANCRGEDGKWDFAKCAQNSRAKKPELFVPKADKASIREFFAEMKASKYGDAAREMEQAIQP